jgi:hypothetical protein
MMISKFNMLIRSRLLWGVMLVIIVLAFVVWGMGPGVASPSEPVQTAEGSLDGRDVSPEAFRAAYVSAMVDWLLKTGRDLSGSEEASRLLRQSAWQRLAALRQAAAWNLRADDDETRAAIVSAFTGDNGVFNRQAFENYYQQVMYPRGISRAAFENYFAEEIAIRKLAHVLSSQAQVAPEEIRRMFASLMDTFSVDYATVAPDSVADGLEVTPEMARAAYDADPEAFRLPELRRVAYAAFPIDSFLDESAEIPEDDLAAYYNEHITDYMQSIQNEDGTTETVTTEFDTVKDAIAAVLRREAAIEKAEAAATQLTADSMPARDGTIRDFADVARAAGLDPVEPAPFSAAEVPVADAGPAFTAEAFRRELGAFDAVSYPVFSDTSAYVLKLLEILPSRIPEFSEVEAKATEAAREKALHDRLAERAEELRDAAQKAVAAGSSFITAVRDAGGTATSAEPFTGFAASQSSNPLIPLLASAVVTCNPGEFTDVLFADDGTAVFAVLNTRIPGDEDAFESQRLPIANAIRQRRGQELSAAWMASLLSPERFTDYRAPSDTADDAEDAVTAEEEEAAAAAAAAAE